jgi:hypothetical protein
MSAASILDPLGKRVKLHPGHLRLDDAPVLTTYTEKLKKLGYLSVEQVRSAAETASVHSRLNAYLGADVSQVLSAVPKRASAPQLSLKARTAKYSLGIHLKDPVQAVLPKIDLPAARHLPAVRSARRPPSTPLGNTPDVEIGGPEGMSPIRDQANRGTCVAHAAVAVMEQYLIKQGRATPQTADLSEQFLYWNCKSHDGDPHGEGTFLKFAMPLLFSDGCCSEAVWGYNPNPIPGNEGQGPPPAAAESDAATCKAPGYRELGAQSVQDIKDALAADQCVAVSLVVFEEDWMTEVIRSTGAVTMPAPGGSSKDGHAVCLVGYEDLDGEPEMGGGRFILRNSWDSNWGVNCEFGTGYGTIPYGYLTTYGMEAYVIE